MLPFRLQNPFAAKTDETAYARFTDSGWNTIAAATWKGEITPADPNSLNASGPCPRCRHDASGTPELEVALATSGPDLAAEVDELGQEEFTFVCDCRGDHAGRPDGRDGCGAYWRMVAQWRASAGGSTAVRFFAGRPATVAD